MENVIDLGSEREITVKYGGKDYVLREPTIGELDKFSEMGDGKKPTSDMLAGFLSDLGMPKEIALKMGMSKATALLDGLMDMLTKKK